MGKHGNSDNGKKDTGGTPGYEPKHAGSRNGYDWAEEHKANEDNKKGKGK